jgi:acyl carrier protein
MNEIAGMDLDYEIREVVKKHARLAVDAAALSVDADLYDAGLTSHASVNLMLALEERFDIEFPDSMLQRRAFESLATIRRAIEQLLAERAA